MSVACGDCSGGTAGIKQRPGPQLPAARAATGNHLRLRQHWRSSERDDIARQAFVNINTAKARSARLALAKLLPDSMQEEAQGLGISSWAAPS